MKNLIYSSILLAAMVSCSNPPKQAPADTPEAEVVEPPKNTTETALQHPVLKEQLFFFLRNNVVHVDQNTFVKYEDLKIQGDEFTYLIVEADHDLLQYESSNHTNNLVHFASYSVNQYLSNDEQGDTTKVTGTLTLDPVTDGNLEATATTFKVSINGEAESSYLYASPYEYGSYDRMGDGYEVNEELIVNLNEPKIYNQDELYLKARIQLLTKEELKNYTSDQLAYLRNELFARHGHAFKTEKMQGYFQDKSWYGPYFDDATEFLNDMEKQNAQFIKSLES